MAKRLLTESRRQELSELAEFVADEYCPNGPVSPETILEAKGVTSSFGSYGDTFDGLLEYRAGDFHVFYNRDRLGYPMSPRARFTLGHELGHYFIDEHRCALIEGAGPHGSLCEYVSDLLIEVEADTFSSSLLMPRRRFLSVARRKPKGMAGVLALKEVFKTSITSTALRYIQEELVVGTLVKWNPDGSSWPRFSPTTFADAAIRQTIRDVKQIPVGSPTAMALADAEVPECGFFRGGSSAATWFPFLGHRSSRNVIMIEEAIRLGEYGVLTLLYPADGTY